MKKADYDLIREGVLKLGEFNCTGIKCENCPLALDGVCMVVTMARQLSDHRKLGNVEKG